MLQMCFHYSKVVSHLPYAAQKEFYQDHDIFLGCYVSLKLWVFEKLRCEAQMYCFGFLVSLLIFHEHEFVLEITMFCNGNSPLFCMS